MSFEAFAELWPWALLSLPAYAILAWLFPPCLRPLFWIVAHCLYRFTVYHRERIPATGPVLLVCNHVTYLDWLLLWVSCRRPTTFVSGAGFVRSPWLRPFLSFARGRIVAIETEAGHPHATAASLAAIVAALDAGRVVVLFPEQTVSRNGQLRPFGRGVEWVLERVRGPVVVIPTYLDNLWGAQLSWDQGRIFWKWPRGPFRRRVAVYFGRPMPATSTAVELRAAVQECNAECGICQSDSLLPLPRAFVRKAAGWRFLFRPAFVDVATGAERRLTWGRALVGVWALSRWLSERIGSEPTIGVWLPTGLGSTLANFALGFQGKTVVNLNYTAGADAVGSAIRQAAIRTVITSKRFETKVPTDLPPGLTKLYLEDALASVSVTEKTWKFLAVVLLPGWFLDRVVLGLGKIQLDDLLTILFSSGSTGEPKGVMLTHRNIAANVDGFVKGIELIPQDCMLATLPFFHTFGYTVCLWAPAAVGMTAIFFPDPRQAKEIGELCKKHGCTILLGTATFLRFYLRRAERDDFRSLRLIVCGAEKLPVPLAEEFREKFGILPFEGYGCTELSPVVSTNMPDVVVGGVSQIANTPGTVGQPIPNVCAKAFDPETFAPLPHGAEGILGVKGANVMIGYLHQPEKTQHVIRDGWYMTGDMGKIEDTGFIRITGRISRFAKIAGEMVPLEKLDESMHEILETNGDRVLVVTAVPDTRRGERVVVLHLDGVREKLPEVIQRLRAKGFPNLWMPDLRDCHRVEAFPILGSGKLDLRGVSELAKAIANG